MGLTAGALYRGCNNVLSWQKRLILSQVELRETGFSDEQLRRAGFVMTGSSGPAPPRPAPRPPRPVPEPPRPAPPRPGPRPPRPGPGTRPIKESELYCPCCMNRGREFRDGIKFHRCTPRTGEDNDHVVCEDCYR